MWWAIATLTTIGYGDVTPVTGMGKFFGAIIAIIGIGVVAFHQVYLHQVLLIS